MVPSTFFLANTVSVILLNGGQSYSIVTSRSLQSEVQQLGDLCLEVKAIQDGLCLICQPHGSWESPQVPPPEPKARIKETTWAEEMDICEPIDDEDKLAANSCDELHLVEVDRTAH